MQGQAAFIKAITFKHLSEEVKERPHYYLQLQHYRG